MAGESRKSGSRSRPCQHWHCVGGILFRSVIALSLLVSPLYFPGCQCFAQLPSFLTDSGSNEPEREEKSSEDPGKSVDGDTNRRKLRNARDSKAIRVRRLFSFPSDDRASSSLASFRNQLLRPGNLIANTLPMRC